MFGWEAWLEPNDVDAAKLKGGPVFSDASLCLDAAAAGQGVFLAWETLATDAIKAGRIVAPLPGRFTTGLSYWFVEPEKHRNRVSVAHRMPQRFLTAWAQKVAGII